MLLVTRYTVCLPVPLAVCAGTAASAAMLLVGLVLTVAGAGGVELDTQSFKDSFFVGALGQLVFGADVFAAEAVDANPLFVAGWAGLVINALNMIPIGERSLWV